MKKIFLITLLALSFCSVSFAKGVLTPKFLSTDRILKVSEVRKSSFKKETVLLEMIDQLKEQCAKINPNKGHILDVTETYLDDGFLDKLPPESFVEASATAICDFN